jgi:hypothetical protein
LFCLADPFQHVDDAPAGVSGADVHLIPQVLKPTLFGEEIGKAECAPEVASIPVVPSFLSEGDEGASAFGADEQAVLFVCFFSCRCGCPACAVQYLPGGQVWGVL